MLPQAKRPDHNDLNIDCFTEKNLGLKFRPSPSASSLSSHLVKDKSIDQDRVFLSDLWFEIANYFQTLSFHFLKEVWALKWILLSQSRGRTNPSDLRAREMVWTHHQRLLKTLVCLCYYRNLVLISQNGNKRGGKKIKKRGREIAVQILERKR